MADTTARLPLTTTAERATRPTRAMVLSAYLALYVVWGSTYLAIRYAVQTIPPFAMAGARFVVAGSILALWAWWREGARATAANWRAATIAGVLLLVGGNGTVVWSEQRVPSGLAALLVAAVPLWMVLVDWLRPGGRAPRPAVIAGIVLGMAGIGLLVGLGAFGGGGVDPVGAIALILASLSWAIGAIYSRRAAMPKSAILATGLEMLTGGIVLLIVAAVTGEYGHLDLARASGASVVGWAYLVVFGSLIGFTAFAWLIRVSRPALVSTYAFVNPVIAVLLGWAIAGEQVGARTVIAAAIIVGAVALITFGEERAKSAPAGD